MSHKSPKKKFRVRFGRLGLHLKLPDDGCEGGVLPALLVQQRHVVVELADVGGVHLQVGALLDEDVRQPLVVPPGGDSRQAHTHIHTHINQGFCGRTGDILG